jgi:hypothetical protein
MWSHARERRRVMGVFTDFEADVGGPQRKVISSTVAPLRRSHGDAGIPVADGVTKPFRVTRLWSAPAGNYPERWYLVQPETREVLHEGPERLVLIWGLQAPTEVSDEIHDPLELTPGTYRIFFALGGIAGGEVDVEAFEVGGG